MLFSVEQAFVGRDEIRAPLKTLALEAILRQNKSQVKKKYIICNKEVLEKDLRFHVMMCKTREGVLSSESEDGDTVFLCLHQSYKESKKDKKTTFL